MSLNKQQMIGAVGAGVFVLLAGGMGYMLWDAMSQRMEAEENLEMQMDTFRRYNSAAVFPSKKSIADVESNKVSYVSWQKMAMAMAARGDRSQAMETPPIFKQRLQSEVRRLADLPGGVDGKICAPTFLFGFEQYLGEGGVLPSQEEVGRLATQLDLIVHTVDMLAEAGILEVQSVQRVAPVKTEDGEERQSSRKKGKKKAADSEEESKTTCLDYAIDFTTRPSALVTALNRLTSDTRFITIKKFSFKQTADQIVDRLAAVEAAEASKNQPNAGTSSRRRRRGAAAEEEKAEAPKKVDRLVVDPELDAPILVSVVLSVYDFGHASAGEAAAEASEKKEEK